MFEKFLPVIEQIKVPLIQNMYQNVNDIDVAESGGLDERRGPPPVSRIHFGVPVLDEAPHNLRVHPAAGAQLNTL